MAAAQAAEAERDHLSAERDWRKAAELSQNPRSILKLKAAAWRMSQLGESNRAADGSCSQKKRGKMFPKYNSKRRSPPTWPVVWTSHLNCHNGWMRPTARSMKEGFDEKLHVIPRRTGRHARLRRQRAPPATSPQKKNTPMFVERAAERLGLPTSQRAQWSVLLAGESWGRMWLFDADGDGDLDALFVRGHNPEASADAESQNTFFQTRARDNSSTTPPTRSPTLIFLWRDVW